jgi:hypothetical protein
LAVLGDNSSTISVNGAVAWDFYNNGNNPSWSGALLEHAGTAIPGNLYGLPASNLGIVLFQNVQNGVITSNGSNIFIAPLGNVTASFLTNGNVGIGTTNPGSFKLAVEGKIGAREVHVTSQSPWPDYVFSNQYKLKSLNTLEDYIKKNNRLPGMPSAAEVKNDGFELGKMNTRVVEKIEELTLYIIDLNKKIEKLEKDNATLRKQINK